MPGRMDGWPSLQSVVLDILREAPESLHFDHVLDEVARRRPVAVVDPRKALRNAIRQVELIQETRDGYYAYVPNILAGASFRLPLSAADRRTGRLRVGPEIVAALWPGGNRARSQDRINPSLGLPDGKLISPAVRPVTSFTFELLLPKEFGDWVRALRRDGLDAMVLRCLDGNAERFALEGARTREASAVAARNTQVLETAQNIFRHTKAIWTEAFGLRLLARGAYHGEPQPDPLARLLFGTDGRFCLGNGLDIAYRPELTPGLRRLFEERLSEERTEGDLSENALAGPFRGPQHSRSRKKVRTSGEPRLCYRFKVGLQWDRSVWRMIEILDNQTLEHLHYAIQEAFEWDNDHLYSFFLSGRAWDRLTGIAAPFDSDERPTADEVEIAELELQLSQKFLYVFDYGDELRHEVQLVELLPAPVEGVFPRIVETHGEAPPQYPLWDDGGEDEATAPPQAMDAFEQAEAKQVEHVRAGASPPVATSLLEQLDDLMQQGYGLLEARQSQAACDRWLEAWELVKQMTSPDCRTTAAFDKVHPGKSQLVFNWCQDLEAELGNAGIDNPVYNEHRVRYSWDFLSRFPDEEALFHVNFMRAQGESLWRMGRRAEADDVYGDLVRRFPDEAWGYIGWADNYWLYRDSPKEYERAEAILKRGLAHQTLNDRDDLLERLEDLYAEWGRPDREAAIAAQREQLAAEQKPSRSASASLSGLMSGSPSAPHAKKKPSRSPISAPSGLLRPSPSAPQPVPQLPKKPSRNAPCWCGSGKKYKKCHLQSDETSRR